MRRISTGSVEVGTGSVRLVGLGRSAVGAVLVACLSASGCAARADAASDNGEADESAVGVAIDYVTNEPNAELSSASAIAVAPESSITSGTFAPDPFLTHTLLAKNHVSELEAYHWPDGPLIDLPFVVPNPHQFGGPLSLMVTEGGPGDEWLRVQLPVRPNGQQGWVRLSDYVLGETRVRAEVNLADRSVRVFDGEVLIAESLAVVGAVGTPTPLGTFFVAAKKVNSEAEYFLGPTALVLSGFSEVLETFSGGLPVIAIHGTDRPDQIGSGISNGCVRVPNEIIEFIDEYMPLGAPIEVVG